MSSSLTLKWCKQREDGKTLTSCILSRRKATCHSHRWRRLAPASLSLVTYSKTARSCQIWYRMIRTHRRQTKPYSMCILSHRSNSNGMLQAWHPTALTWKWHLQILWRFQSIFLIQCTFWSSRSSIRLHLTLITYHRIKTSTQSYSRDICRCKSPTKMETSTRS